MTTKIAHFSRVMSTILRLAQNLRRVQASLERIIPALEALQDAVPAMTRADNSAFLALANTRRHQAALAAAHRASTSCDAREGP